MASARVLRWWSAKHGVADLYIEIACDGESSIYMLDADTAQLLGITASTLLSEEALQMIYLRHRSLGYIQRLQRFFAHRVRSSGEIIERLRRLGAEPTDIRDVLEYLCARGLLDDERFARAFVRDKVRFHTASAAAIRHTLLAKGISAELADRILAEEYPSQNEFDRAYAVAEKAWCRVTSLEPRKRYRRVRDRLLRQGYSPSLVRHILERLTHSEE
ncbi:MAG: RecX family transcriptional regulator [Chlorobi bacterium]|nr:RecX family transcriptional regulator [Chlorobiota bacterium]